MSKRGYDNDRGDDGFKRARPFDGPQIRVLIPRTVGTFCSGLSIKVLSEHFGLTLRMQLCTENVINNLYIYINSFGTSLIFIRFA